jgi:hypothetical protein
MLILLNVQYKCMRKLVILLLKSIKVIINILNRFIFGLLVIRGLCMYVG